MSEQTVTRRDYVTEFRDALMRGIEGIVEASRIYVEAIDDDPNNVTAFRTTLADFVPDSAWSSFEAVGRKWLHPRLLMGGGGRYANKIKRLPYSTQEAIFSGERFDLLTSDGDTLKVDIRQATSEQVDQLLDGSTVRSLSAQRAWIEARRRQQASDPDAEVLPYTIRNGCVTFRRGVKMTRTELRRLLTEM